MEEVREGEENLDGVDWRILVRLLLDGRLTPRAEMHKGYPTYIADDSPHISIGLWFCITKMQLTRKGTYKFTAYAPGCWNESWYTKPSRPTFEDYSHDFREQLIRQFRFLGKVTFEKTEWDSAVVDDVDPVDSKSRQYFGLQLSFRVKTRRR